MNLATQHIIQFNTTQFAREVFRTLVRHIDSYPHIKVIFNYLNLNDLTKHAKSLDEVKEIILANSTELSLPEYQLLFITLIHTSDSILELFNNVISNPQMILSITPSQESDLTVICKICNKPDFMAYTSYLRFKKNPVCKSCNRSGFHIRNVITREVIPDVYIHHGRKKYCLLSEKYTDLPRLSLVAYSLCDHEPLSIQDQMEYNTTHPSTKLFKIL